jgi:PTH1 family peptidyl-tRNA hydrolase
VKFGGGDNGHNGLRSIRSALGTGDYYRVRVGVGRPVGRQSASDHVLSPLSGDDRARLVLSAQRAADAAESLLRNGLGQTQQEFNR